MVIKFRVVRCVGHNAYGVDCFYVPCPSAGPYGVTVSLPVQDVYYTGQGIT